MIWLVGVGAAVAGYMAGRIREQRRQARVLGAMRDEWLRVGELVRKRRSQERAEARRAFAERWPGVRS